MKPRNKVTILVCKKCGHNWVPRISNTPLCPSCHTPYWNRERKAKAIESINQEV